METRKEGSSKVKINKESIWRITSLIKAKFKLRQFQRVENIDQWLIRRISQESSIKELMCSLLDISVPTFNSFKPYHDHYIFMFCFLVNKNFSILNPWFRVLIVISTFTFLYHCMFEFYSFKINEHFYFSWIH